MFLNGFADDGIAMRALWESRQEQAGEARARHPM